MQDEESLVQRARQRDREAFSQLYEQHFDRIHRYIAVKIGDRIEAEDMAQQVFVNAFQAISSFKWKGVPFSAWLYRIAHNQVVDYLRKKTKAPATLPEDSYNISDGKTESSPQLMTERSLDIERLLWAIRRLTEAQREVIALRFTGDLSTAEIARIMGRSQGAVKALQHSAIVALRKALLVETGE